MSPRAIGILGSDAYVHLNVVRELVASLAKQPAVRIVTRARGSSVDRTVRLEATRCGIPTHLLLRQPTLSAEHQVVACVDELYVFWDGRSPGTRHAIALARAMGVPVRVHGLVE